MMIQDSIMGTTNHDLAEKYQMTPTRASDIVNHSPEVKDLARKVEARFDSLIYKAIDTVEEVMDDKSDNTNRLKAALAVVERVKGKVPVKIEYESVTDDDLISQAKTILAEYTVLNESEDQLEQDDKD